MKLKILIGIILIVSVIVVYGMFVSEMKKLPFDYKIISEHEGQDKILDSLGGELSPPFWIRETLIQEAISVRDDVLEIRSTVIGIDSATNDVIFENEDIFFVDRTSRKHQGTNDYFAFPQNVQKQNYEFFHPMIFTKTVFEFNDVREIDGLEVYDFVCKYDKVDMTSSFPQFSQQTILSDGRCIASVEPVTGLVVSFSKNWDDYFIHDDIRGEQVELGGKQTTEYSEIILTDHAKSTKSLYYLLDVAFPILITVIGVIVLTVSILFEKIRNQTKTILKTQNELLKKEKLSAIGKITSMLSHDLRNSLTAIKLSSEAMQMRLEKNLDVNAEAHIPIINESVSRIMHQVNQVLGFVKTMPLNICLVSLSTILDEAIRFTPIPENIEIIVPKEDYSLMADRVQMSVVFGNLISNAADAIDDGGKITIRANTEGENLILEFEDSGTGIAKSDLNSLFEPLFTTKSEGIGLGLSSVKDIITTHGGKISVTSHPTIFKITLPLKQT